MNRLFDPIENGIFMVDILLCSDGINHSASILHSRPNHKSSSRDLVQRKKIINRNFLKFIG